MISPNCVRGTPADAAHARQKRQLGPSAGSRAKKRPAAKEPKPKEGPADWWAWAVPLFRTS